MSDDGKMVNKIVKEPLRSAIRRELIDNLFQGNLEPGQQLNERDLAVQLGISRTPLREALIGLEYEGLVEARPSRGFRVATLDADTARQLCTIVATLEGAAVRELDEVDEARLDELDELTRRRTETDDAGETIRLDAEWHRKLIEGCEYDELLELVEMVRTRLYFYEYAYLQRMDDLEESADQHRAITAALREGDLEEAAELLKEHWQTGIRTVGVWLDETG